MSWRIDTQSWCCLVNLLVYLAVAVSYYVVNGYPSFHSAAFPHSGLHEHVTLPCSSFASARTGSIGRTAETMLALTTQHKKFDADCRGISGLQTTTSPQAMSHARCIYSNYYKVELLEMSHEIWASTNVFAGVI